MTTKRIVLLIAMLDLAAAFGHAYESPGRVQPVVAHCGDKPIHGFGKIFINGFCPDFETGVVLLEGNTKAQKTNHPEEILGVGGQ